MFHSNAKNVKQFSRENATKLFEYFPIKIAAIGKYSLIYIVYYQ